MNIALFSPSQNAYSETFIQNHKNGFEGDVFFYYGGFVPTNLEGVGKLKHSRIDEAIFFVRRLIGKEINYDLLDSKTLIRSLKKNKIDVIYAEYGTTGAEVIGICKEANVPLIVNFHGADSSVKSILSDYKYKYSELFDFAKAIIVVSVDMKNRLMGIGCPENKITYIANAPSNHFFEIQPTYQEDSFVTIGRFVDKKAPYYTILAFKKVLEQFPIAKLYMIGQGPLFEVCHNIIAQDKLKDSIIMKGVQSHSDIAELYTRVKGFVQHSITSLSGDVEGMPVAVLEASAAALPVISTRHAGIPDVIIENETGFLVDEHDVESMAAYMIKILEEEGLAQKMGKAGRKNIKENFNLDMHITAINGVIRESI